MLSVRQINSQLARAVVELHHYLHRKPVVSHAFGLYEAEELVGVVTFGPPASRNVQTGACPSDPNLVTELNRLWVDDRMERNTESFFVSRALKLLPPRIVVSYADTSFGHLGFIYRACNFLYAGWTDMDRKTPRYDYIVPGKHSRDAFRCGDGRDAVKVRRKPKVRYWAVTGNKRDRKALKILMQWSDLCWKQLPPPQPQGAGA